MPCWSADPHLKRPPWKRRTWGSQKTRTRFRPTSQGQPTVSFANAWTPILSNALFCGKSWLMSTSPAATCLAHCPPLAVPPCQSSLPTTRAATGQFYSFYAFLMLGEYRMLLILCGENAVSACIYEVHVDWSQKFVSSWILMSCWLQRVTSGWKFTESSSQCLQFIQYESEAAWLAHDIIYIYIQHQCYPFTHTIHAAIHLN